MGLTDSLHIGRSALVSQQAAMQVIGNNIANAGNPEYARQTARLAAVPGVLTRSGLSPGLGVELADIRRHVDQALEERLRSATSNLEYDDLTSKLLSRLESLYNEMTDYDLSTDLNKFFNAWGDLQNNPQDSAMRAVVIQTADALTQHLRVLRSDTLSLHEDLNSQLSEAVAEINRISGELATINGQAVQAIAGGSNGSGLLDRRDGLLRELSGLADIHVVTHEDGAITVYLGNDPLVDYNYARQIELNENYDGKAITSVARFSDNHGRVAITSGQVGAIVDLQQYITQQIDQLDTLAKALIGQVNKLHSSGQGLVGWSDITSQNAVSDPTVALNQLDLTVEVVNGGFLIHVTDESTGQRDTHYITVDQTGLGSDTTLNDLAAQVDACDNISATVTADGRLNITADASHISFTFSEDSSGVLAALGVNSFFAGANANDIAVNPDIVAQPALLAASQLHLPGDGSNAGAISALNDQPVASLSGMSITEYYRSMVSSLGVANAAARNRHEAHNAVHETLLAQRETVSGVSLDEEAVALMASQHAFEGAARYISVINELIQQVLNMV